MKRRRDVALPLGLLAAIYVVVLAADFVAPYDYFEQNRDLPLAAPTRLRFIDSEGHWHLRPFVYRLVADLRKPGAYVEEKGERYPVRFFVEATSVRRLGPFELRRRLFGVDGEARILLLGTDRLGRDQLSRWLYGGRISLVAGLLAGLLTVALGLALGAAAGYYGGKLDAVVTRLGEVLLSLPWLYLLIAVRAFLPLEVTATEAFLLMLAVIGLIGWVVPARMVRGVVLAARERDFVYAARGFGSSEAYLLRRHVLPEAWGVALTQLALNVPRFIVAEVTLSFLGLGVTEPVPSWGNMLALLQRYHVLVSYYWMSFPAIALIGVVLGYHRLASSLQERFDAALG